MKICILTNDARFKRMLELFLSEFGFYSVSESDFCSCDSADRGPVLADRGPVLADLDCTELTVLKKLSQISEIYGWSRKDDGDLSMEFNFCTCLFHRPFLMSELLESMEKFLTGNKEQSTKLPSLQNFKINKVSGLGRRKNMLSCNVIKKEAVYGAVTVPLSECEMNLLKLLCENRGNTVTHRQISELFNSPQGNIGDVYICRLRKKLDNALGIKFIYTVRGEGYVLK